MLSPILGSMVPARMYAVQRLRHPTGVSERETIERTRDMIVYVLGKSVFSQSLCGHHTLISFRFEEANPITALIWVAFEDSKSPWLAVLVHPDLLFLYSPDGTQVEIALASAVDAWPVVLDSSGRQGLLLQERARPTRLFTTMHPLQNLEPVSIVDRRVLGGCDKCVTETCDDSEHIIFVSEDAQPAMVVTYSTKHQVHRLQCLSVNDVVPSRLKNQSVFSRGIETFVDGLQVEMNHVEANEGTKVLGSTPDACAVLVTPNIASRVFHSSIENGTKLLCLVMQKNTSEKKSV